jgi:hypothetical protein
MSCNRLVSRRAPSLVVIPTTIFRVPCWQKVRNRLKKLCNTIKIHSKKRCFSLKSVWLCYTAESSCSTRTLNLRNKIFQPVSWLEYKLDYRGIGFRLSASSFCLLSTASRQVSWPTQDTKQWITGAFFTPTPSPSTLDQVTSSWSSPLTFT